MELYITYLNHSNLTLALSHLTAIVHSIVLAMVDTC